MSEPCPEGQGEGYGVCEEDGPVLVFGISASMVYGLVLCLLGAGGKLLLDRRSVYFIPSAFFYKWC